GDDATGTFSTSGALTQITSNALSNSAADTLTLKSGTNYAIAGAGADDINVVDGTNFILGDQGQVSVSETNVTLTSSAGNASDADLIDIVSGDNVIVAGSGGDLFTMGGGNNSMVGDDAETVLTLNGDVVSVKSINTINGGDDVFTANSGNHLIIAGDGLDVVTGNTTAGKTVPKFVVVGDSGYALFADSEVLIEIGTSSTETGSNDVINLTSGDDIVIGGSGGDTISAGGGINDVLGDDGKAQFFTDGTVRQTETVISDFGAADTITLDSGMNTVIGGSGADKITTGNGTNTILGDEGRLEVLS
ncbi:MAG: calcium-binding protein, partial [Pirellula sp.]